MYATWLMWWMGQQVAVRFDSASQRGWTMVVMLVRNALALGLNHENPSDSPFLKEQKRRLWHLIGHLQKNKVKQAVGPFALIHSVDSWDLLRLISREAEARGLVQAVLLQDLVSMAVDCSK